MIKKFENFKEEEWDDEEYPVKTDAYGREIVKISDIADYDYPEDIVGWTLVQTKQIGFDGEKGFADFEVILRRDSDGKFFKVEYCDYGRGDSDFLEQTAVEVERKEKTVYYYE